MADDVNARRRYDGTKRQSAAEQTRLAVLASAQALFTERGYATTSVTAIAERAGVSVDTVYAAVGRKPHLLLAVHDMALAEGPQPVPAEQRQYVQDVRAAQSAVEKLRLYCAAMGRLLPRTVPLMVALKEAALTDPDCAAQYDALSERRAASMRVFAGELRDTGELRTDLTLDEIADLIWSLNSPEWFSLITSRGYSSDQYATLLAGVLCGTLFSPPLSDQVG